MFDHAFHHQLDDLIDMLKGLFSSMAPYRAAFAFQGRAIRVPPIFIRLNHHFECIGLHWNFRSLFC